MPTGAGAIPSLDAGTDFGRQQRGNFITARTFRITNDSSSPITIDEIGGDGAGFFIASGYSTSAINAGGSTNFFLRPASEDSPVGIYDLTVSVSADGGFSSTEIPVRVIIIAPPEIAGISWSGGDTVLEVVSNGSEYYIQSSTDLTGWNTLTTLGTFNGSAVVIPEALAQDEIHFFRLVGE